MTQKQQQKEPRARLYGDWKHSSRSDRRPGDWYYDADGQLQQVLESVN